MHLTTLMPPALIGDAFLWLFLFNAISDWPVDQSRRAIYSFAAWMIFSKFIKLVTHFARYPIDIFLWPVSVLFGWFHGAIKIYACITLSEVSLPPSGILGSRLRLTALYRQPGEAVLMPMPVTLAE